MTRVLSLRGGRSVGPAVNALIRASIVYFLVEAVLHPDDPRFAGKALPMRNVVIVGGLSLLFPALHLGSRRWKRYPVWYDNLFLSIFWLDMAGNSFDLYNRHTNFDLIPHCHGTGALTAVLMGAFDRPLLQAVIIANGVHALLELQEYYTDVFAGTHNVRGSWDTAGDTAAGLLGSAIYAGAHTALRKLAMG